LGVKVVRSVVTFLLYETGLRKDGIVESGGNIMYTVNIPQESVTIPETI
jgi:hypothetical protein